MICYVFLSSSYRLTSFRSSACCDDAEPRSLFFHVLAQPLQQFFTYLCHGESNVQCLRRSLLQSLSFF